MKSLATSLLSELLGTLPTDQNGILLQTDTFLIAIGKVDQNCQLSMRIAGGTFTGDVALAAQTTLTVSRLKMGTTVLTYAASVQLDFTNLTQIPTTSLKCDLTGPITLTTAHLSADVELTIKFLCDGTPRALGFPAWIWVGGVAPATLAAGKTAILSLKSYGTTDGAVLASWAVQS